MEWADIWKIILGVITSVGGIGGIILISIKISANIIAERLSQKYEMKMQKELAKYQSGLENRIYITKAKFDAEFSLYQSLSKSFFDMVKAVTIMIPAGYATYPADKEARKEYENKLYDRAQKTTVEAQDLLNSNIPFIPETLCSKYEELLDLSREQLVVFEMRWDVYYLATQEEKETFTTEDYQRSREIRNKFNALNVELREYLSKLDIID